MKNYVLCEVHSYIPTVQHQTRLFAALAFAVPLAVYLFTLCPTVFVGDSGELALAATNLEIAHPPGYPLLTLVGHLWTDIFFFLRPIVALNLFSAVCAALASMMIFLSVRAFAGASEAGRSRGLLPYSIIALAAGWLVAFGHTLWSAATSFEVYALSALLFSAALYCWLQFYFDGKSRWLLLGAYLLGLILTNHLSAIVIAPLPLAILVAKRKGLRIGTLLGGIMLFLLPLTLYYYLPIRSRFDLVLDWYNPESWAGLKQLLFAQTYRQRFVAAPLAADLLPYLRQIWHILSSEWGLATLVLALPGIYLTVRRRLALGLGLVGIVILNLSLAFPYVIIDIATYYLPTLIVLTIWIAVSLHWLAGHRRLLSYLAGLLALLLVLASLAQNWSSADLSDRQTAESYARDLFAALPAGGVLFCASDMSMFPTLYLRYAEGFRDDVEVNGVLCTLPKLRRDLGLQAETGYNSLPPLLQYAADSSERPIALAREPLQFDHLLTLLPGLYPENLVAYVDSSRKPPAQESQLDWQQPPALFDPKEAVLYAQYYLVRAEEAEPEQARRLFEQAAELISDTEQPILLTALTSYLVEAEQLGLAGRICAAALNLPTLRHRQRLSLLLLQAKIALGSGDGWLAQNSLKKVLNLDPQNIEAQVLQLSLAAGEAAQAQEFTRAIGLYQQMIELAPQQTELHFQLGRLYLEAGQPEMAAQMFEICRQRGHRTAEIESLQAVESQS